MPTVNRKTLLGIFIHMIGWGILISLPFFFFSSQSTAIGIPFDPGRYWVYALGLVPFALMFYINYFSLIDRFLFRKKIVRFLAINLLLVFLCALFTNFAQGWMMAHEIGPHGMGGPGGPGVHGEPGPEFRPRPPRMMFVFRDALFMAMTVGLSVAIKMTGRMYRIEQEKQEMEQIKTEAELKNLKNQLNPHFLFNTLNNIYSLIAMDPDRAQYAVHGLSRLLRHVLYENNYKGVPLDKELTFVRSYIELMTLRLSDHVKVEIDIPQITRQVTIAPLLFIALIENAFKHGVSHSKPSRIRISIRMENNRVKCRVENTSFPKADSDRSGSGIGIINLQKRLELLYPQRHVFLTDTIDGVYVSELALEIE